MNVPRSALTGILSVGLPAASLDGAAQPALEPLRFDPPKVCPRTPSGGGSRIAIFPVAWRS